MLIMYCSATRAERQREQQHPAGEIGRARQPERLWVEHEAHTDDREHDRQAHDALGDVAGQEAPYGVDRHEQLLRQVAADHELLELPDDPDEAELAHHEHRDEVADELDAAQRKCAALRRARPHPEQDQRQHAGEHPQVDLGPVLQHVGEVEYE